MRFPATRSAVPLVRFKARSEAGTKANAKIQAALLRESSTVIAALVKDKKIKVVAGYYDLATGAATLLE